MKDITPPKEDIIFDSIYNLKEEKFTTGGLNYISGLPDGSVIKTGFTKHSSKDVSFIIPDGWQQLEKDVTDQREEVISYIGIKIPDGIDDNLQHQNYCQVVKYPLEKEIEACDWLTMYLILHGYTLKDHHKMGIQFANICITKGENIGRASATRIGNDIVYSVSLFHKDSYNADLAGLLTSNLQENNNYNIISEFNSHPLKDIELLLDKNWILQDKMETDNVHSMFLTCEESFINLSVFKKNDILPLDMFLNYFKTVFNIVLSPPVESLALHPGNFKKARRIIYKTTSKEKGNELWIAMLENNTETVLFGMFTPPRTSSLPIWAINKRNFGISLLNLIEK